MSLQKHNTRRELAVLLAMISFFAAALLVIAAAMSIAGNDPLISDRTNQTWVERIIGMILYGALASLMIPAGVALIRYYGAKRRREQRGFEVLDIRQSNETNQPRG